MSHTAEATLNVLRPGRGEALTVNGDRYRAILNEFLFTKVKEEDIGNIWFQQDGATTPHSRGYTRCFAPCF